MRWRLNRINFGIVVFALTVCLGSFAFEWSRPGRQYPYFGDIGEHYKSMWHWLYSISYLPLRQFFTTHSECFRNLAFLLAISTICSLIANRLTRGKDIDPQAVDYDDAQSKAKIKREGI